MKELSIIVLLYNKEISQSSTINSILSSGIEFRNTDLVIWNNGPTTLSSIEVSSLQEIGLTVRVIETPKNESLSTIYNRFIDSVSSKRYLILDDDSNLSVNYLQDVAKLQDNDDFTLMTVGIPVVSCNNKITSPLQSRVAVTVLSEFQSDSATFAIGSGIVIGADLVNILKNKYGNVFDEKFYFYGVDVTFFHRVNELLPQAKYSLLSGFDHSLSKMKKESEIIKSFRRKERSYDLGLRMKYYYPRLKSMQVIIRVLLNETLKSIANKPKKFNVNDLIKAYIKGIHYKNL